MHTYSQLKAIIDILPSADGSEELILEKIVDLIYDHEQATGKEFSPEQLNDILLTCDIISYDELFEKYMTKSDACLDENSIDNDLLLNNGQLKNTQDTIRDYVKSHFDILEIGFFDDQIIILWNKEID